MLDDVTIAVERCREHPPPSEWPARNLIESICPRCGWTLEDTGGRLLRELRARRLLEERA